MARLEPLFGLTLGAKTKARCNLGNSGSGNRNGNARARERPARLAADSLLPETQVLLSAVNDFFNVGWQGVFDNLNFRDGKRMDGNNQEKKKRNERVGKGTKTMGTRGKE